MKLLLLLLFSSLCLAQQNHKITYELEKKTEIKTLKGLGVLTVDKLRSISNFNLSQFKNLPNQGDIRIDPQTKDTSTVMNMGRCDEDKIYYYDFTKDSLSAILYGPSCESKVLVKDKINYPNWELIDEFKEISGYKAQKAKAFVNDRTWTVFFTTQLGINAAPWRLVGLPGVVLEATENTKTYSFKLSKIEKIAEDILIPKPYFSKKSTFKQYVSRAIKEKKDIAYFVLSQIEGALEVNKEDFPLYETIEFIEKREPKKR